MKSRFLGLGLCALMLASCQPGTSPKYVVEHDETGDLTAIDGRGYQELIVRQINFVMLLSHSDCPTCSNIKSQLRIYVQNESPIKIYLLEFTGESEKDTRIINYVHEKYEDTDFDLLNDERDELRYSFPTMFLFLSGYHAGHNSSDIIRFVKDSVK